MGKGTIISHIADGQYNVTVNYDTSSIDARIIILQDRKTLLETELATETDEIKIRLLKLQILSVDKQIAFLNNTSKVPADFTTTAWCADLTTDLTGAVGTIEIGREKENGIQIQPGYESNATYSSSRDGQLVPLMAQSAPATFYNLAMLPGTQKWKPTFLYGTITAIDYGLKTCTVMLDSISSSQQALNIVSTAYSIADVPIEYMDCDATAFTVGDEVIVKYTGYDPAVPTVIGFKEEPKPCDCFYEPFDGPAINTLYPWTGVYVIPPGVPTEMNFSASLLDTCLYLHLPAQTVAGRHTRWIQLVEPAPNGWVKESATRAKVICPDILATCSDNDADPLTKSSPSALAVIFTCEIISTGATKNFWIFFFADDHLDGVPVHGYYCSNVYGPNYLYEYAAITRTYFDGDFVYLPYGTGNAMWVDFPEPVKVKSIYCYANAQYGLIEGDPAETYDLPAPEMMFKIDSIEIC